MNTLNLFLRFSAIVTIWVLGKRKAFGLVNYLVCLAALHCLDAHTPPMICTQLTIQNNWNKIKQNKKKICSYFKISYFQKNLALAIGQERLNVAIITFNILIVDGISYVSFCLFIHFVCHIVSIGYNKNNNWVINYLPPSLSVSNEEVKKIWT